MCVLVFFAIIKRNDKILLVKNRNKEGVERWTLPGGKVEEKETLYEALCREIVEETKYTIRQAEIAYIHEAFFSNIKAHVRAVIFHAQINSNISQESLLNDSLESVILD